MGTAVLVRGGRSLFRVGVDGRLDGEAALAATIVEFVRQWSEEPPRVLPAPVLALARRSPSPQIADSRLGPILRTSGLKITAAPLAAARSARQVVPWPRREERELLLALAHATIARELASPEQTVIALAREESRVDRTERRETEAQAHWLAGELGPLAEYRRAWVPLIEAVQRHHERLSDRLDAAAGALAPNLSAVVGERIAARLIAEAGGLKPLARMSASRLQLLGARRRPRGGRGPRHGVIFGAFRMTEVPPDRAGAYARSLAAMAAIAARADAFTRAKVYPGLVSRRDRRVETLRRRRR